MSDTPRTDAECDRQNNEGWSFPDTRKFASQLERELADVTEELDKHKEAVEFWRNISDDLKRVSDASENERDELKFRDKLITAHEQKMKDVMDNRNNQK